MMNYFNQLKVKFNETNFNIILTSFGFLPCLCRYIRLRVSRMAFFGFILIIVLIYIFIKDKISEKKEIDNKAKIKLKKNSMSFKRKYLKLLGKNTIQKNTILQNYRLLK